MYVCIVCNGLYLYVFVCIILIVCVDRYSSMFILACVTFIGMYWYVMEHIVLIKGY